MFVELNNWSQCQWWEDLIVRAKRRRQWLPVPFWKLSIKWSRINFHVPNQTVQTWPWHRDMCSKRLINYQEILLMCFTLFQAVQKNSHLGVDNMLKIITVSCLFWLHLLVFQASRWTIVGQIVANTTSGDLWFRITKKIYFLPPPLSQRNDYIWHKNFHNCKAFNARWLENWIKSQLWQIISPWILIIEFRTFEHGCPKLVKINLEKDIAMWRFKVFHVARLIHICAFYTSYTFSTGWKEMLKFIQSFYTLIYIPPDIHNITFFGT